MYWIGKELYNCIICNFLVLDFKLLFSRLFDNNIRIVMRLCFLVSGDFFNVISSSSFSFCYLKDIVWGKLEYDNCKVVDFDYLL